MLASISVSKRDKVAVAKSKPSASPISLPDTKLPSIASNNPSNSGSNGNFSPPIGTYPSLLILRNMLKTSFVYSLASAPTNFFDENNFNMVLARPTLAINALLPCATVLPDARAAFDIALENALPPAVFAANPTPFAMAAPPTNEPTRNNISHPNSAAV